MDTPPTSEEARRWQHEADLLAEGRELLENRCASSRYRYLYPQGPNLGLLLSAYQEFDRLRTVGRVRGGKWRQWRAFKRILERHMQADMLDRSRRLSYRYPSPRLHRLPAPPPLVRRAMGKVEPELLPVVEAHVGIGPPHHGAVPGADSPHAKTAASRGIKQFRDAMMQEALQHPESIPSLHPQYLWLLSSAQPTKRRHPIATLLFVRLPLQLVLLVFTLLNLAYVTAYYTFNDEVLGGFVSDRVSGLIEGELRLGSIHWHGGLIFDLLTGTPHYVVVENVDVYEPWKSTSHGRAGKAAHADRIEATLVLHEIIPWNRIGIPRMFEIPWVLHFGDVVVEEPIWFHVREYDDTLADGTPVRYIGLRDAFRLHDPPQIQRKGLSFAVDDATLRDTGLDVDFKETTGWRAATRLERGAFHLAFVAPDPTETGPMPMPFTFEVSGVGNEGTLHIAGIDIPLTEVEFDRFASNKPGIPAGDVFYVLRTRAAGSGIAIQGTLRDALWRDGSPASPIPSTGPPPRRRMVELYAFTEDVGSFAQHVVRELDLPPDTVEAAGVEASASIVGPLDDPVYTLASSGLTLDLFEEPAWGLDDVTFSLSMATVAPPEPFADRFGPGEKRRIVTFEALHGTGLGGKFGLRPPGEDEKPPPRARIVMPLSDQESYFFAFPLRVEGIDPAQLVPDLPELTDRLRGTATGDVDLRKLELGPIPPPVDVAPGTEPTRGIALAEVVLADVDVVRDNGPKQDGLPRRLGVDGTVVVGPDGSIDFGDLVLTTDGTRLRTDGGIDSDDEQFRELLLELRIEDGRAFAKAFDLPPYFERLDTRVTLGGPFGAPDGTDGKLAIAGVGSAKFGTHASLWMDRGTLHVRAPDAQLFGGHGRIDIDAELFARGSITKDPRVQASVDLDDVELGQIVGDVLSGRADVELEVGDGHGGMARLSDVRVHGKARAKTLTYGGTTYRDAEVEFRLTTEEVHIERLVLPIHRPVSPRFARGVTVPVGQIVAEGTISLDRDPALDLQLQAEGVPLSVVTRLLEVDVPLRGQIGAGTQLAVGGSARRPRIEGQVALEALSAQGIALGSGKLEVTSNDVDAQGRLAAHRELRIVGELATRGRREKVQWTVDAVTAFGAAKRSKGGAAVEVPVAAQLDVEFDELALATLLRDPADPMTTPQVEGRLAGVSAQVLTCNPGAPMLSDCVGDGTSTERTLEIELEVDEAWVRSSSTPLPTGKAPCADKATLCSATRLRAELDWPMLTLKEPWRLENGGGGGGSFEVSGSFDLGEPPGATAEVAAASCRPPAFADDAARKAIGTAGGSGDARVEGMVDLETLAPLLEPYGLRRAKGRLDVELRATGFARDPRLAGVARLALEKATGGPVKAKAKPGGTLEIEVEPLPYALEFSALKLGIDDGWLTAVGSVRAQGSEIEFGTVDGAHTGYALAGRCGGTFGVAAKGTVSAGLLRTYLGETITAAPGGVDVPRVIARGSTAGDDGPRLDALEGTLALERTSLGVEVGIGDLRFDGGRIDFRRCSATDCPQAEEGWFVLDVGGLANASSTTQPTTALRASAGPSGRGAAWGRAFISPRFDAAVGTDIEVRLDDIPYRGYDQRGGLAYELAVSSDNLQIRGGTPLVIDGDASVDRARYVKDAVQGVEILTLIEDSSTQVDAPPPDILQGLTFNVRMETDRPLRVENNIATGVEATAVVEVTGTYEDPEFTGRLDVEPGGVVDIPFLTGTYEIQRGRVTLLRELEDAEVDVLALRNEPIYIRDQPRRVQLLLQGTLSEIRWSCIADGDSGGELETVRGCTEYLVLGTGDVQLGENDVQRFGAGGLAGVRKPLQVVGHLTEFDVGKRVGEAVPRMRTYVPDVKLRLGQIGPELEIATPQHWLDFDYGHATFGYDYTRGYPGFLLRQSQEAKVKIRILDPVTLEYSRRIRSYLNERIIFDPLEQDIFELRFDFEIPTIR